MVIHDYICPRDHVTEDVVWPDGTDYGKTAVCATCGRVARIYFGGHLRMLNIHKPGMGYGQPWPSLGGRVVESYSHKQQIMKELGLVEANDPIGGKREPEFPTGYNGPGQPETEQVAEENSLPIIEGDSLEDIEKQGEELVRDANNSGGAAWDTPLDDLGSEGE